MASGCTVQDDCVKKFDEMKLKRAYKYMVFCIESGEIKVDQCGAKDADYDAFVDALPENSPRYGLFDYEFETEDHCHKSKVVFFSWIPDTARIKEKMMYASSKENLKRKLNGIQVEVQATDASEIEQSVMHEKCMALAG